MPELPKRKHPRLKNYDYHNGMYFITICSYNRNCIFSDIVEGQGFAPTEVRLFMFGKIAEEELQDLPERYPSVIVNHYVIMPNHIHLIISIEDSAGASPRPTVMDVVCTFKSLVTRRCKGVDNIDKVFQTSFYDHVIRNEKDYLSIWEYIDNNPAKWAEDEYYR